MAAATPVAHLPQQQQPGQLSQQQNELATCQRSILQAMHSRSAKHYEQHRQDQSHQQQQHLQPCSSWPSCMQHRAAHGSRAKRGSGSSSSRRSLQESCWGSWHLASARCLLGEASCHTANAEMLAVHMLVQALHHSGRVQHTSAEFCCSRQSRCVILHVHNRKSMLLPPAGSCADWPSSRRACSSWPM